MSVRLRVTLAFTAVMALVLRRRRAVPLPAAGRRARRGHRAQLEARSAGVSAPRGDDRRDRAGARPVRPGRAASTERGGAGTPLLTTARDARARSRRADRRPQHGDDHVRLRAEPRGGRVVVVGEDLETARGRRLEPRHAAADRRADPLLLAALAGYGATAAALRPVERMRARAAADRGDRARRAPAGAAGRRRDRAARARRSTRCSSASRRRSQRERTFVADASHELRTPLAILQDRARAGAAPRPHARGADGRAALGERGDRPARRARRGPARDRAQRPGAAADPAPSELRAAELLERVRERFARRSPSATRRSRPAPTGSRCEADPLRARAGARQPARQRAPLRRRARSSSRPRRATARCACTCATTGRASRPTSPPSSASPAATRARGRGGAGLGLAIVAAIARAHGGEAGAADRPDGGADVWIELPRRRSGRAQPGGERRCAS